MYVTSKYKGLINNKKKKIVIEEISYRNVCIHGMNQRIMFQFQHHTDERILSFLNRTPCKYVYIVKDKIPSKKICMIACDNKLAFGIE